MNEDVGRRAPTNALIGNGDFEHVLGRFPILAPPTLPQFLPLLRDSQGEDGEGQSRRTRCKDPSILEGGVWAEVKVDGEHSGPFSEQNAQGVHVFVYYARTKKWIVSPDAVNCFEGVEEKSALDEEAYLQHPAYVDLPRLTEKKARSR